MKLESYPCVGSGGALNPDPNTPAGTCCSGAAKLGIYMSAGTGGVFVLDSKDSGDTAQFEV